MIQINRGNVFEFKTKSITSLEVGKEYILNNQERRKPVKNKKENGADFFDRHPYLPLILSIASLLVSIAKSLL
jgi:hypothetical protein